MTPILAAAALTAATVLTGLVAGLYYSFAMSVMPGLARADDRTFLETLRHINAAILNGWFALGFVGAPVLQVVAAVAVPFVPGGAAALPWLAAAFLCYVVTLLVTFRVNVPLNNALDAGGPAEGGPADAQRRRDFEAQWVRFNVVRAVFATASLASAAGGVLAYGLGTAG
ncbi:DUF1772 domain-containing protein [Allonocardiopsis opalescens]|uniref:Putative membrane protein n=1 Tax=Allonocardiopsis opalescens TaxID=1144618 RepID=A0A2T0Q554_9ACTN|nr:anthrone oxygenase family protein [Allonocardiopsis opalescens]PRX98900.1 putative membrane protein [Allonocardiopsis opalescens]